MATILVVDDRSSNRKYLATLLAHEGHSIQEAADGAEALKLIRLERVDLVISDILMPTMDGYELVRQLRADPAIRDTPVIFNTAHYLDREARNLAQSCGVPFVLNKPGDPATILRSVESVLVGSKAKESDELRHEAFDREHLRLVMDKLAQKSDELQAVSEKLAALIEVGQQLAFERDSARLMQEYCHAARRIIAARHALVGLLSEGGLMLDRVLTSGVEQDTAKRIGVSLRFGGVLKKVVAERRAYRMQDPNLSIEAIGLPSTFSPVHSFLAAPVASSTQCYGWLCLTDKLGAEGFGEDDERVMVSLAAQMAVAHENARLYQGLLGHAAELGQEVAERKVAQHALQKSEKSANIANRILRILLMSKEDAMYADVLDLVLDLFQSELGFFGYIREVDGALVCPSMTREVFEQCRVADKDIIFPREMWGGLWGQVLLERTSLFENGPHSVLDGHVPVYRSLGAAIVCQDKLIGSIHVANKNTEYTEEDRELMDRIVSMIAPVLNARLERDKQEAGRKQAAEALRESEERYRELFENANDIIYTLDLEGRFTSINRAGQRITGYSTGQMLRLNLADMVAPEYADVGRRMLSQSTDEPQRITYELEIIARDGQRIALEARTRLIYRDGLPVGIQGIARDVTERKRLEAQFLQAQKMEAVGRLAGGMAHDFNNLLTAIIGYTQLSLTHLDRPDLLGGELAEVRRAGERAGELTRQLLLFSRKQILQPRVLELNGVVSEMKKMLRRLISEDIELVTVLDPDLGSIKADPGQIEQALLNLAVNARDAMPEGGKLIIRTANSDTFDEIASAPPGRYVTLDVADNGCGMDSMTQSRIFEPFFTTKEQGKGTGLGLSTVYGMVEQTGGKIEVVSKLGVGTTFRIYLPRVDSVSDAAGRRDHPEMIPCGTGTVLLVEDEQFVRELAAIVLREQGYTVLEAADGEEGLKLAEDRRETGIDLLVTDVVMPKLGGRELAARLAELLPETKVLYVSAYPYEAIAHPGPLEATTHFLQKPFTPSSLATKVREVLDGCMRYAVREAREAGYVQDPGG